MLDPLNERIARTQIEERRRRAAEARRASRLLRSRRRGDRLEG